MTVSFSKGRYGIALARDAADVAACQALRHRVFRGGPGRDADARDADCEHVMISDATGLAATCRFLCLPDGRALGRTYAAARYDLGRLAGYRGAMLELGRFCVRPDVRDADILRLVWGVLAQVVDRQGIALMFGCSSFAGTDPARYHAAFGLLAQHHLGPARWRPGRGTAEAVALTGPGDRTGLADMPPLLRSYLGMGGWVSDHAVVDHDLQTLHVFTALEVAAIPPRRAQALRAIVPATPAPAPI